MNCGDATLRHCPSRGRVAVGVGVIDGVGVAVGISVFVALGVGVNVGVAVRVGGASVLVCVGVGDGVGLRSKYLSGENLPPTKRTDPSSKRVAAGCG